MNPDLQPKFSLGVNYWPRRKAMYWWSDFDAGEVREEFSLIRDLGLDLVRIFLLWDDWQPTPDTVNAGALRDLGIVADIASDLGLKLDITFFTGHMSGPNWAPGWMLRPGEPLPPRVKQLVSGGRIVDCGYANPYTDPTCLAAEELILKTVVTRLRDHPAVGVWNLGNEPDLFAWPPDAATGRAWVRRMTGIIREVDPDHPVTCGLHTDSIFRDNGLRIHDVFAEVDWAVMHGYPMYVPWLQNPLDIDYVPFICALTTALCGKPTLMEEFGGCTVGAGEPSTIWEWTSYGSPRTQFMASEEDLAAYITGVLPRLVDTGATGAVVWCFADYAPELWDKPPCDESIHERFFGLVRPDGSVKPHALAMQQFAATSPKVQPPRYTIDLVISPEDYYQNPVNYVKRLYQTYVNQLQY
jgi:endo-1,4-beta-mannosidase